MFSTLHLHLWTGFTLEWTEGFLYTGTRRLANYIRWIWSLNKSKSCYHLVWLRGFRFKATIPCAVLLCSPLWHLCSAMVSSAVVLWMWVQITAEITVSICTYMQMCSNSEERASMVTLSLYAVLRLKRIKWVKLCTVLQCHRATKMYCSFAGRGADYSRISMWLHWELAQCSKQSILKKAGAHVHGTNRTKEQDVKKTKVWYAPCIKV